MNDSDIITLMEYVKEYIGSLNDFRNIRILINRHCKNNRSKEHIHVRIIFDSNKAKFNEVFKVYADEQFDNNGILDLKSYNRFSKEVVSKDFNSQVPYAGDALVELNKDELHMLFLNKSYFVDMLNYYSQKSGKGEFNLKKSQLYVFFWMDNFNFVKGLLSFGEKE